MRILRRIAGIARDPVATFDDIKDERFRPALAYLLVLLVSQALVLAVAGLIVVSIFLAYQLGDSKHLGWVGIGALGPLVVLSGFVTVLLAGLILHPLVRLLGGKQGLRRTMQAVVYGSTPLLIAQDLGAEQIEPTAAEGLARELVGH